MRGGGRGWRFVASVAVVVLTLSAALVAQRPPISEAGTGSKHEVKVSPRNGLLDFTGDGQYVGVRWSGFHRGDQMYMRECVRGATDPTSQCSSGSLDSACGSGCPGIPYLGESDRQGAGSSVAQVGFGLLNTRQNLDPIDGKSFTCDYQHRCSLFFLANDPNDLAHATEVHISFARPLEGCPTDVNELSGSGGSSAARLFLGFASATCDPPRKLGVQYILKTGPSAMEDFISGASAYAVTSDAPSGKQLKTLADAGRTTGYAPVAGSGMVFAYKAQDRITRSRITNLTLSPRLLAMIFTGQLQGWSDPELRKLNPHVNLPNLLVAIGRGDQCEETATMTRWMWENARSTWIKGGTNFPKGQNPFATGPTDLLPSAGKITLVTGANQEARSIAQGTPDANDFNQYGMIGYVDSSFAAQYSLSTVRIAYPNGKTVAATPKTIAAGIDAMKTDANGFRTPDVSSDNPKIWPMSTVSYEAVPQGTNDWQTPPKGSTLDGLAELIRYAVGPGARNLPGGYVPLPRDLKQQAFSVADQMRKLAPAPPPDDQGGTPPPPPFSSGPPPPIGDSGGGPLPQESIPPSVGDRSNPQTDGTETPGEIAAAQQIAVAGSGSRLILPITAGVGIIAGIVGFILLFGDRVVPVATSAASSVFRRKRSRGPS